MLRGGERLVYQGPNKLNLLRIKDIYSFSPHPLYSEVDRMMVMYVKMYGCYTFFNFARKPKLAIKKSMILIEINDIIPY